MPRLSICIASEINSLDFIDALRRIMLLYRVPEYLHYDANWRKRVTASVRQRRGRAIARLHRGLCLYLYGTLGIVPLHQRNWIDRLVANDGRATWHPEHAINHCLRKRVKEPFGWINFADGVLSQTPWLCQRRIDARWRNTSPLSANCLIFAVPYKFDNLSYY